MVVVVKTGSAILGIASQGLGGIRANVAMITTALMNAILLRGGQTTAGRNLGILFGDCVTFNFI